ncbi:siderophore-interacting protein [Microbacterium sp. P03]|uniref:siderophore-interacting protein n=1 Tax=Microbacterium sp. P03 TaxID=3366946 RepID=UPI003745D6F8
MTTRLTVTGADWTTPHIRRIHFRSDDLSAFAGSDATDRYVKLVFLQPGVTYPEPLDVRALRGILPPEHLPDVRTYTALFPDVAAGTLAIDFVVHGDEGVAGPWAAHAQPGDTLLANGPGGAYRPDPDADWHLLVGDESALPAVIAAAAALDADAVARVIVLVEEPGDEAAMALPDGGRVQWVYRAGGPADGLLLDAVRSLEWPVGTPHVFVHGEAQEVMHRIRPYLFGERGLRRDRVSISGYWRYGRTEESFREWKHEQAESERAAAS